MNPIVLSMIICDHYYRDSNSGKSIISGTFNSINSVNYPSKHGNCAVYISMSDVAIDGELQLEFKKVDGSFSMKLPKWGIKAPGDRQAILEIGGNINGLPLPEEGFYEFVLSFNGIEISSRRLKANRVSMEQPSSPDDGVEQ